jgi:formylglycine-generating enzyme required for sulfatase activity
MMARGTRCRVGSHMWRSHAIVLAGLSVSSCCSRPCRCIQAALPARVPATGAHSPYYPDGPRVSPPAGSPCVPQTPNLDSRLALTTKDEIRLGGPRGLDFVRVESAKFTMGLSAPDVSPFEAAHSAAIDFGFFISTREVTNRQFREWKPSHASADTADDHPVTEVSYADAVGYCDWLSSVDVTRSYRLPSEAEWERACQLDSPSEGDANLHASTDRANYLSDAQGADFQRQWKGGPTPVGSYPPGRLGLYDIHGNVWEWCSGTYRPYVGPVKPGDESDSRGVIRGGAWDSSAKLLRCGVRGSWPRDHRAKNIGFRVAFSGRAR